ncbi:MAG: T9SS type A sorting domain-containing protein [Saprospiraceae bacterium]|nr:T9SS type A sorting domain-containing protein [Saprospiraceae bacterium]
MKNSVFLPILFSLLISTSLFGQAEGSYDLTYGNNGITVLDGSALDLNLEGMALQPDGKLILAGYTNVSNKDAFLARLNLDGSLDQSFADNGFFIYDYANDYENIFRSVEVQEDGKIIAMGYHNYDDQYNWDLLVVRLNSDGTLDSDFGLNNGASSVGTSERESVFNGSVAPSGKIVLTGNRLETDILPFLCRFNADGLPDDSFDGFMVTLDSPVLVGGYLTNAISDEDGNVYATGATEAFDFIVVKVLDNGAPDPNFGNNGILVLDSPNNIFDFGTSIRYSASGDLLYCGLSDEQLYISKIDTTTGDPITSFGDNGKVIIDVWNEFDIAEDIIELPNGQIIITGTSNQNQSLSSLVVVKLNADGTRNEDWGLNGIVFYDFNGLDNFGIGSAVQPDGKIVSASWSHGGQLIAIRYLNPDITAVTNISPAATGIQFYPNPSSGNTVTLEYVLQSPSDIQVDLFNALGQQIAVLIKGSRSSGLNTEALKLPSGLSTGIYLIQIKSNQGISTQQLVLEPN